MNTTMWFVFILLQWVITSPVSSAHDVYYVMSDAPSETCPVQPCLTLSELMEMDRYFITGSTFVFLAGNHSLNTSLGLADVSDLTLRGDWVNSTASIFLGQNTTLVCENVSNFHIEGLTFILCKYACKIESVLLFLNSNKIIISNSVFQGNEVAEVRSVFSQNSNITVLNCLFQANGGRNGGALKAISSSMNVTRSKFIGNNARGSNFYLGTIATGTGGAISVFRSVITLSWSRLTRNCATVSGGALNVNFGSTIFLEDNTFDNNISGRAGGAVYCAGCLVKMRGNNMFLNNSMTPNFNRSGQRGGAVTVAADGKLEFESGTAAFSGNKAKSGGAIAVSNSNFSCDGGATVVLDSNHAAEDGGGMKVLHSCVTQSIECKMSFSNNVASRDGGGVSIGTDISRYSRSYVALSGDFINNSATCGGAASIKLQENVTLRHANIVSNSEHALCMFHSVVTFKDTRFINNSGNLGGAVNSSNSILFFEEYNMFAGNMAESGGAMYLVQGTASFDGDTTFEHNSAKKNGGAICATGAVINLNNSMMFVFNSAYNGGAVYLNGQSFMTLNYVSHFNFSFNAALGYGGGIYHVDNTDHFQCSYSRATILPESSHCLLKFKTKEILFSLLWQKNISMLSHGDSAGIDGSFLYGGLLDRCRVGHTNTLLQYNLKMLEILTEDKQILTVTLKDNSTQAITSRPYGLCLCDGPSHSQGCSRSISIVVHRGQKFTVPLLAIAQGSSITSTSVTAITSSTATLKLLQSPQNLAQYCSNLTYNLYSTKEKEEVVLYPDGPCRDIGSARVVINLTLLPCPDGFALASNGHCLCAERLQEYNISCTIDEDFYLTKGAISESWIGVEYVNGSYEGLILYKTCPVEYCRTEEVNMTLHDLDTQCAHGRIGVLCGRCAEDYSLLIGSSKCRECSNAYLALLLPFAAAGIVLVVFLSVLRLTVATGMINSLILYANIVQVNRRLFFHANTVNILTVFIAWLNLDLGFETCFYDGMDAFAQTCLQFVFPVYLWVLICLIILTSRYSITVSKLIGHNPIAVLATLLLMSYAKVLKIIIDVYSSVKLDYPHNKTITVWLKDANVPYLQSKHLALTVVTSLLLVFLFLPYFVLLLLGHKLYRFSARKPFCWLKRTKPLLDSYYAPYRVHTRYWTGLLLFIRCALYVVFSFNSLGGTRESLLAIIIAFTAVGFAVGFVRIYTQLTVNILEASACMNLVALSAISLADVAHKAEFINAFVTIMLIATLGVIFYHIYITYVDKSMIMPKLKRMVVHLFRKFIPILAAKDSLTTSAAAATSSHCPNKIVSKTVIELREPLLES